MMALTDSETPPPACENYRHWTMTDKDRVVSTVGDLLTTSDGDHTRPIILTMRDPVERLESEYGFIKYRVGLRRIWARQTGQMYPARLCDYCDHEATHNPITKFLAGRDLFDAQPVPHSTLRTILNNLEARTTIVTMHEDMGTSIARIERAMGIDLTLPTRRMMRTQYKPRRGANWEHVLHKVHQHHALDLELYAWASRAFNKAG